MTTLNSLLIQKPQIGILASATGAILPFIDAVTKFAQCGAAICGFAIGAYTLYLKLRKKP